MVNEIDNLVDFAIKHHPGFALLSKDLAKKIFETYEKTILVYKPNGQIRGFALYQEWPDCLNCLAIAGDKGLFRMMWWILHNKDLLPNKPFVFFDELRMEGRILCHKQDF